MSGLCKNWQGGQCVWSKKEKVIGDEVREVCPYDSLVGHCKYLSFTLHQWSPSVAPKISIIIPWECVRNANFWIPVS